MAQTKILLDISSLFSASVDVLYLQTSGNNLGLLLIKTIPIALHIVGASTEHPVFNREFSKHVAKVSL